MMNWFSRLFGKTEQAAPVDVQAEKINEKDGSVLVWIPPGEFEMGDGQDSDCPKHQVYLDGYYLGRHCITNKQYQDFIEDTGHRPPDKSHEAGDTPIWQGRSYPAAYAEHPVVCVSWEDAQAYCAWAGLALPTEAQWERAARGTGNLLYPWGNDWDASKCRNLTFRNFGTTCPVSDYPEGGSGFGTLNQSGNVWEWCQDWYGKDYYRNSPARNPEGPSTGSHRVLRGGSWDRGIALAEFAKCLRSAGRGSHDPLGRYASLGFRPCLPTSPQGKRREHGLLPKKKKHVQSEKINEKDGSILVWIPPGEFEMGDGQHEFCPKHRVHLDGYYLGVHCITNRQYQRFVEATGYWPPDKADNGTPIWQGRSYPAAYAEHPVVCVSWEDAHAYCAWAGLALPTEAQWERGARGPGNLLYPWGNGWDADNCRHDNNRCGETTCRVSAYPQGVSGFGTFNQIGNVWEWCRDWYDEDYYRNSPSHNPAGPATGSYRVLRGGSWGIDGAGSFPRAASRGTHDPASRNDYFGFRPCLPPGQQPG